MERSSLYWNIEPGDMLSVKRASVTKYAYILKKHGPPTYLFDIIQISMRKWRKGMFISYVYAPTSYKVLLSSGFRKINFRSYMKRRILLYAFNANYLNKW